MGTPIPLALVATFLGIAIGWRDWVQRRVHGASGIMLFRTPGTFHRLRDAALLALPTLLVVMGLLAWRAPAALEWSGTIPPLAHAGALGAGILLCSVAVAFIVSAQVQMGRSWRVGIDVGARPGLVTGGLFRFSRNPIYSGMLLWHAGFTCVIPTWANAALTVAVAAVVQLQARYEEAYLLRTYGDEYRAYAARVGRFLTGVGRLRP